MPCDHPPPSLQVAYSIFTALMGEFISWMFVFRKDEWKNLRANMTSIADEMEAMEDEGRTETPGYKHLEKRLKGLGSDAARTRMKTGIFTTAVMFGMNRMVKPVFTNRVIATLPFDAPGPLAKITKRGGIFSNMPSLDEMEKKTKTA
ncbi:protein of unknown function DUF106, transmembrane [Kipferlia bialata]|uniref:Uncharacterized protein n=1 Tax=Kipferlia bialata TaxID=797122 RepID=A0A9K3D153_9EUKA|nr:protein of unknown function DUF106, transmembrane [Kipferlia bialata]|eukprot:g9126.t1